MKFLRNLTLAALILSTSAAAASDWVIVEANEVGVIAVDKQSISLVSPGVRKAWVKYSLNEPEVLKEGFPATYMVAMTLQYMDCSNKSISIAQTVYYADALRRERVSSEKFKTQDYSDVVPDSIGEATHFLVCNPKTSKSRKSS